MSDSLPAAELRRSVAVLATEWWLLAGVLAGYLTYGVWVVGTGLALDAVAPGVAAMSIASVGPTTVTALVVFAAVAWLLLPAAVAAWLLGRQLSNVNGNLIKQYRIDHPGVLPAPSGVLMLVAAVIAVALGPRAPVLAVMAIAGVHLLVRTIAFGRRVYSFSPRPLFTALSVVSGLALAAAWLVQAPGLPAPVGEQVASAGIGAVVETGLGAAGLAPGAATGYLVAVPALLSGLYLAVQTAVAYRVRAKAPLADPYPKRGEQRYPIMPPVADSSRPGPPTPSPNSSSGTASNSSSGTASNSSSGTASNSTSGAVSNSSSGADPSDDPTEDTTATTDDDSSHTRVFTTDEPIPEDEDAMAPVAGESEDEKEEDDGWIDDTAIFSPEGATSSDDECTECGEEIPRDSVTFCPNCGERVRR